MTDRNIPVTEDELRLLVVHQAGTSFALSGLARDVAGGSTTATSQQLSTELERLASAVRTSLLALRSLLVEIYPPQLDGHGLGAALQDLVASAEQGGVDVTLRVDGASSMSEQSTALVWRTAQECVRNATRHGDPSELDITVNVAGSPPVATLVVSDNGRGFDPNGEAPPDSFGLRGLRDLAREADGTLTVDSAPGRGTSVTLEVPAT